MQIRPVTKIESYFSFKPIVQKDQAANAFVKFSNKLKDKPNAFRSRIDLFLNNLIRRKKICKSEKEVFEKMMYDTDCVYLHTKKGYVYMSPEKYDSKPKIENGEVIIKKFEDKILTKEKTKGYSRGQTKGEMYRIQPLLSSFTPENVIHFLKKGLSHVTLITNNWRQDLFLPKTAGQREKAFEILQKSKYLRPENHIKRIFLKASFIPEHNFNISVRMVNEAKIPEMKLTRKYIFLKKTV